MNIEMVESLHFHLTHSPVSILMILSYNCAAFMAVWLSGNVVGQINEVTLRRAGLMLRWLTVRRVYRLGVQPSHPGQLSLVIPPWVDEMSTSGIQ